MRLISWCAILALTAGCGGADGPSSTPTPLPATPTFTGSVVDTVSGQPVPNVSMAWNRGNMVFAAAGYVTRETSPTAAVVDMIPEQGFDLGFYRELVRSQRERPYEPLRRFTVSPAVYVQVAGLAPSMIALMEQRARDVVPAFTGGRLQLARWETGPEARQPQTGWIVVSLVREPATEWCGRAGVGLPAGQVTLNLANPACHPPHDVLGHELGHALGFYHVSDPLTLMHARGQPGLPTTLERHHAALAYRRQPGNQDIDIDPQGPTTFTTRVIVD